MRWGYSEVEKRTREQVIIKQKLLGIKKFAWWPTPVHTGWIWLEPYYRYYLGGRMSNGELFIYYNDGWVYENYADPIANKDLPDV